MKKSLFTIIVLFVTVSLHAQDIIVTTDAQKIEAKIIEVSKTEIKYKDYTNLDGPTFVLSTNEISSIIYSNGKVTLYNSETQSQIKETSANNVDNSAMIQLVSGEIINADILSMTSTSVTYSQNNTEFTLPASQVDNVTFANGQVKKYRTSNTTKLNATTDKPNNATTQNLSPIEYYNGCHYINGKQISESQYESIIKKKCSAAWDEYKKGKALSTTGWSIFGIATGVEIIGAIVAGIGAGTTMAIQNNHTESYYTAELTTAKKQTIAGISLLSVGLVFDIISIPCIVIGYSKSGNSHLI